MIEHRTVVRMIEGSAPVMMLAQEVPISYRFAQLRHECD